MWRGRYSILTSWHALLLVLLPLSTASTVIYTTLASTLTRCVVRVDMCTDMHVNAPLGVFFYFFGLHAPEEISR